MLSACICQVRGGFLETPPAVPHAVALAVRLQKCCNEADAQWVCMIYEPSTSAAVVMVPNVWRALLCVRMMVHLQLRRTCRYTTCDVDIAPDISVQCANV